MKMLLIAPLPPPVTGQSLAVQVLVEAIGKSHQLDIINISKASFKNGVDSLKRTVDVATFLFKAWCKRKSADVIYLTISESKGGNIKDLLLYLACYSRLRKMVIHLHGGAGIRKILTNKHHPLYWPNRYLIKRLAAVIVLGPSQIDMFSHLTSPEKIHVVPNFAEDYLFLADDEIRNKFDGSQAVRMLFLSNLIKSKGYEELLAAFMALSDHDKNLVSIDFAGGFESTVQERDFLRQIEGIDQIRYHGVVSGDAKRELLKSAHILCLPTYYQYEGQPICILEAYASGCVVMTTDHSGIRDVFRRGENGFEVVRGSVESIKCAIQEIIEKRDALVAVGLRNREIADARFRVKKYQAALESVMTRVAGPI